MLCSSLASWSESGRDRKAFHRTIDRRPPRNSATDMAAHRCHGEVESWSVTPSCYSTRRRVAPARSSLSIRTPRTPSQKTRWQFKISLGIVAVACLRSLGPYDMRWIRDSDQTGMNGAVAVGVGSSPLSSVPGQLQYPLPALEEH